MEEEELDAVRKARALSARFSNSFRRVVYTLHPRAIPGEAREKSSNLAWAAKEVRRVYSAGPRQSLRQNVIVTVMNCRCKSLAQCDTKAKRDFTCA